MVVPELYYLRIKNFVCQYYHDNKDVLKYYIKELEEFVIDNNISFDKVQFVFIQDLPGRPVLRFKNNEACLLASKWDGRYASELIDMMKKEFL